MRNLIITQVQNKKSENSPDYQVTAVDNTKEGNDRFARVGALWRVKDENRNSKRDKNGNTYLSGSLNEPTEENPGYYIEVEPSSQSETPAETEEDLEVSDL